MSSPDGGIDRGRAFPQDSLRRLSVLALFPSLALLLAHAFIPLDKFVLRSDDAFYYFKVAANHPTLGFWSFDSIHRTNGVQPLWALVLTVTAQGLSWLGVTDPGVLARVFVALTAICHFCAGMLLFHLLARTVSVGTGLAAAGGLLFPLAIVWQRVWGLENSLYALLLTGTVAFFQRSFLSRPTLSRAAALGALLGLTALARLNAGLLTACLLVHLLLRRDLGSLAARLRLAAVTGAACAVLVLPYFALNYAQTGHVLPISGAVKRVTAQQTLRAWGVDRVASPRFVSTVLNKRGDSLREFVNYRVGDGLWILGARIPFDQGMPVKLLVLALLVLPLALRRPREWLAFLVARYAKLRPFTYVLVFALLDAGVSIALYPHQLSYAITRWWLVPLEIVIVVLTATLAAAVLSYAGRAIPDTARLRLVPAALAMLVALHAGAFVRLYWLLPVQKREWNLSWNEESLLAAEWMANNVAPEALVGSWNAGVVGYYAKQRVVNLDGLINNFELLPYLRDKQVSRYIAGKGIEYLSDMDGIFVLYNVREDLDLTEVYSHYSPFMKMWYRIYRVNGPARRVSSGLTNPSGMSAGRPVDVGGAVRPSR